MPYSFFASCNQAAERALRRSEERSTSRQKQVKLMSDRLNEEMLRVMRERRAKVASCLTEYAQKQIQHARSVS